MSAMRPRYCQLACAKAFARFVEPLDFAALNESASTCRFDKNARKLFFRPFFTAWLLFPLTRARGLREHHAMVQSDPLYLLHGGRLDVSFQALSDANAGRPLEPFVDALNGLLAQVRQVAGTRRTLPGVGEGALREIQTLLTRTHLLDSTTCELSPALTPALKYCDTQAGLRVQLKLAAGYQGIEKLLITSAKENDNQQFHKLLERELAADQVYLFDCGYYKLATYDQITEAESLFVTKRHGRLGCDVLRERSLPQQAPDTGYTLLGDYDVTLGGERTRARFTYRLLKVLDTHGEPLEILTNAWHLAAWKICLLYRYRWTIEIVFRWLKRTLRLKSFASYSPTGVQRQLLVALIVYCLLVLYHAGNQTPFSPTALLRELELALSWLLYTSGYVQACLDAGLPPPDEIPPPRLPPWPESTSTKPLRTEVPCRVTLLQTT